MTGRGRAAGAATRAPMGARARASVLGVSEGFLYLCNTIRIS
jgi:hypothetical protein